jgi:hypothetical protein
LLEATPAGERLYRRLGNVVEHESMIFARGAATAAALRGSRSATTRTSSRSIVRRPAAIAR